MNRYWRGERARCMITTPQGERVMLSVPLCKHTDGEISYMHKWQHQHWMALVSAYGKTPYFEYYKPYIEPIYKTQYKTIDELNEAIEYVVGCFLGNIMPKPLSPDPASSMRSADSAPAGLTLEVPNRGTSSSQSASLRARGDSEKDETFLDRLFELGPEMGR